jgi:cytoskeletal protein CcmA (bactofilin family)
MGIFSRDDNQPDGGQSSPPLAHKPTPSTTPGDRTIIAHPTTVEGKITGSGEILIDGTLKGSVHGQKSVRVAQRGRVTAEIHAATVEVAGTVVGNISADQRILLEPTAKVDGNITAPRILIQDGATFKGQVNMEKPGSTDAASGLQGRANGSTRK